ncbi:hypothetical protein BVRB_9g208720 [Beta vulgaris subsp. vulgaris]|nr:hypothetical protein BVRB_9g208720 [Beta vulgaris subsp. vulgaris]
MATLEQLDQTENMVRNKKKIINVSISTKFFVILDYVFLFIFFVFLCFILLKLLQI